MEEVTRFSLLTVEIRFQRSKRQKICGKTEGLHSSLACSVGKSLPQTGNSGYETSVTGPSAFNTDHYLRAHTHVKGRPVMKPKHTHQGVCGRGKEVNLAFRKHRAWEPVLDPRMSQHKS